MKKYKYGIEERDFVDFLRHSLFVIFFHLQRERGREGESAENWLIFEDEFEKKIT